MGSVIDAFDKLDLSLMMITETWMMEGPVKEKMTDQLSNGHNLGGIFRNRGRRGGGVAVIYNKSKMRMSEYKIKTKGHEILVTKGKINNNTRHMFAIVICISRACLREKKLNTLRQYQIS